MARQDLTKLTRKTPAPTPAADTAELDDTAQGNEAPEQATAPAAAVSSEPKAPAPRKRETQPVADSTPGTPMPQRGSPAKRPARAFPYTCPPRSTTGCRPT